MKQHQVQISGLEFQPINQKYFLHEREKLRHDPFADSLEEYFSLFKRRTICHFLLSAFFIGLMIPSIILQAEYIEVDVNKGVGEFEMKDTWDPPISIYMFSKSDDLLIDVQLYLDGKPIQEFTIQEQLIIDTQYIIRSEKPQSFSKLIFNIRAAVRLMAQFNFVPASYLIIIVVMLVISLLYSILTYARYRQL
ncbi:unnamed protein product (macronuclear) [Paramecium tetraurelia]|uniref:GOLD domain-containing protein n=1 Tax=Paramecium tetraurelia TaxID=5888 RepID=A0C6I3_PARTE|nr:uncharacterized protein GSPATT00035529001 [Paramecium tetraurelia]CAK66400.1 unnamed protein product [Paramecium tetraurelia]|eukprot:XP_001433797.1 hypothetical protein (macronuclear) [Paramecium tetraurelia strain d4-2]